MEERRKERGGGANKKWWMHYIYSRTSDSGHSEKRTTSERRTISLPLIAIAVKLVH